MSQIIKVILLSIFNGEQGTLPDTFGVLLHGPSKEQLRLHFDFRILCQDGASQKYSFGIKGGSGSKSCLKCTETAIVPPGADAEEAALRERIMKIQGGKKQLAVAISSFCQKVKNKMTDPEKARALARLNESLENWEEKMLEQANKAALRSQELLQRAFAPCTLRYQEGLQCKRTLMNSPS